MSRRLEELERAKVRLEALVRAAASVGADSTAIDAWNGTSIDGARLLERSTHALASVYAAIEVEKRRAEGRPS